MSLSAKKCPKCGRYSVDFVPEHKAEKCFWFDSLSASDMYCFLMTIFIVILQISFLTMMFTIVDWSWRGSLRDWWNNLSDIQKFLIYEAFR